MFHRKLNMDSIFHEKQEGSLCAQHCLNNLLQGEYFTPVDLSSIAHQLDEEERMRMAEGGMASEEYRTFLQQPSGNMDDSGFFSIQVISNALRVWGLELILFNSPEYQRLMINPINEKAFICNYKEHWFTIRKLGQQWFNLNSLLTGPELISDTYLALFLAQLQQEGYSIFVIRGNLPECEAEQILGIMRVHQQQRPRLIGEDEAQTSMGTSGSQSQADVGFSVEDDDEELKRALALSRQDMDVEDEEADVRRAIQLSMQGTVRSERSSECEVFDVKSRIAGDEQKGGQSETLTAEELRKRRQAYFDRQHPQAQPNLPQQPDVPPTAGSGSKFWTIIMGTHKLEMPFIFVLTYMCFLAPVHQAALPNMTISDLSYKNMDFAMDLYRKISNYHDNNVFFSPLSISTSFAVLLMASGGGTHQEILRGLNLQQLEMADQPELIPRLFQLLQENIAQNGSLKVDQSMALFIRQQFEVEKAFEDKMRTFFHADIKTVDFADIKGSVRYINEYIRQKTKDKITKMLSTLDETTLLLLINSIFFQGTWLMPFNSNLTRNGPFYIDNYNIIQVPMMFKEDKFYTMEDVPLGARVLKLPYQEGVSMLILLPNKGIDYTVIDDEITAEKFLSWVKELRKTRLEVSMPKFKMEQEYSLHNLLPDMGMVSLFGSSANLTGLSKEAGLRVSEVRHKAVMEVDETGTTAAAATTTGIIPYSLPRMFTINRPFFFFIYHEDTNCLLFMGRVINPSSN
ncbi:intracellular coagulation inhibitor 3-like isoform X1 [Girardinichthys multiradiatus]|uniref:intracellular coagulation inhibitor 3-like isoform X1 n=1 Tax=Girardinichthys multiradiatus TaxID=208333 RepID=UPI001FABEC7B|nr:intracellular coagulation inhibitor 3-like isoform X1 [Girardinichthys multiradiatus]